MTPTTITMDKMKHAGKEPVTRWYEEPWAWFVIAIPLGTIVICSVLITIATTTSDGLVADDYYKRGLEINKVLDREARAAELGLALSVGRLVEGRCEFELHWNQGDDALPATVPVHLSHATRDADQQLLAEHLGNGHYRARPAALAAGPWYVDVGTPDWRVVTRVVVD